MEELLNIAMAYYQASSDHHQALARAFFDAMDHDGNGEIDQKEFTEFLIDEGYAQLTKPCFFEQLDLDKNGKLDFSEVMMLYYILKSGRPFCDKCNKFIPNTYFTCVGCLEVEGGASIHLCLKCYIAQKCDHTHNGLSRFADNYSLLEAMLKSNLSTARSRPSEVNNQAWNPPSTMNQVPTWPPPIPNQHSWSHCAPTAPHQNLPLGNNHAWNQSFQVPNSSPPIPSHHLRSQSSQTAPLQNVVHPVYHQTYIHNRYSHHHTPPHLVQTPVAANAIVPERARSRPSEVNNQALNPSSTMNQVPNRPPPIPNQHSCSHCAATAPLQNVVHPRYHPIYIHNNYSHHHTPPHLVQTPAAANANVLERQQWKIAFEALNTALYVGAIGGLCSIL